MSDSKMPKRTQLLGFAVLAAVFLAGGVTGVAIDRTVMPAGAMAAEAGDDDGRRDDDDDDDDRRRSDLLDRLDLTEDQSVHVDSIRDRWHERVEMFWDTAGPRIRAIAESARAEIRTVLTPEQRARYDSLRAAHRREHREKSKDKKKSE